MSTINSEKLIEELEKNSIFRKVTNAEGKNVIEIIESQPPADQWIPCSDTRKPADGQKVVVTVDLFGKWLHIDTATYHAEIPKGWWEHEWEGEGFYQSHECGWCRREDVVAWFYTEPYKGE